LCFFQEDLTLRFTITLGLLAALGLAAANVAEAGIFRRRDGTPRQPIRTLLHCGCR